VEGDLAAILNLITDDVEFVPPISSRPSPVAGSGQVWRGGRGVEEYLRTVAEAYEFQVFEPGEFIVDQDNVVVLGRERCRVRATDRVVKVKWVQVFTFRDGRVCRHREYTDTAAWEAGFQTK
jgi:ketosteroid isomerase-like protein